jgi:archaemetzincin
MQKLLLFPFCCLIYCSCNTTPGKPLTRTAINIQPFSGTDPAEVAELADSIRNYITQVNLLPAVDLPDQAYYKPRARYKADSILTFLSKRTPHNQVTLGITKSDISTSKGKNPDWGVMGLGQRPGTSCVASSFRLNMANGKNQLFKVSIHELGHTMGLPHCPVLNCYMRDANSGNPLDEETGFCKKCSSFLRACGWRIN